MTEQLAVAQQISTRTLKNMPTSPLLYLSSAEEGWEELVAQAFHEPMELEGLDHTCHSRHFTGIVYWWSNAYRAAACEWSLERDVHPSGRSDPETWRGHVL